jgi:hypothetical protein
MPLYSKLFKGDIALEACLIKSSAHVLEGAKGLHVTKIQTALQLTDGLQIEKSEIDQKLYGKSTAKAVLAYKTQRKIVNLAYQTKPDNIVGQMTIAALDWELCQLQRAMTHRNSCAGKPGHLVNIGPVRVYS